MAMELPTDMIEEILSWVPCRSLERFKSTCKQWETLITEPRFIKKNVSHMRGREQQFTVLNNVFNNEVSTGSTVSFVGIDFDELDNPGWNLQVLLPIPNPILNIYHCDGLLLFVTRSKLLVLNPVLKEARWIKCGYGSDKLKDVYGYGLGYISNQSSSHCDYRMVRFRCGTACQVGKSRIEVYEFKSDSWRVVVNKTFDGFFELPKSSVCLRGTPSWLGYLNGKTFAKIQSFDFSKEIFESLFLPPSCIGSDNWQNSLSLGVYRGDRLSLLHKSSVTGKLHLWVMKKHWSRLMIVAQPEFSMCPKYSSYFIEKNGKLVLSICVTSGLFASTLWEKIKSAKKLNILLCILQLVALVAIMFRACFRFPVFSRREEGDQVFFKRKISDSGFNKKE